MKPQTQPIKKLQSLNTIDHNSITYISPEYYYGKDYIGINYRDSRGDKEMNYLQLIHKFNVRRYNSEMEQ